MRRSLFSCSIFTGRKSEPFWGKLWHVIAPWVSTKCQEIERGDIDWVYEHWLSSYGPATALILTHKIPLIKIQARKICHWIFLNKLLFVETILYLHSMAIANLNKSEELVTNSTAASKCIPKKPRICIIWNPPFRPKFTY